MQTRCNSIGNSNEYFSGTRLRFQKENGTLSDNLDCILITKDEDEYQIGFYRNLGDRFILIDKPVVITDTYSPNDSANDEFGVPCIQAIKKDGSQTNQIFISKGKLIQK